MNTKMRQLRLFRQALQLSKLCIGLGGLAVGCFCIFGTLASMVRFHDSQALFAAFYYLPYALIAASILPSLYLIFLMGHFGIIQRTILRLMLILGLGLPLISVIFYKINSGVASHMTLFLAILVWFAMPYVFKVNSRRFLQFLTNQPPTHGHAPTTKELP